MDLEYAIKSFEEYRKNYPQTERINLKAAHMKRVMQNNIQLAKKLKLSMEDVILAGIIGLIHDIGRFEQVKRYDTYVDKKSIDHAMFSSEQLFENGLIRQFIKDSKYDSIIKAAIENHNKYEIEQGLTPKELLHSKLIRDSDKIDIYIQVMESNPDLVFDGPYNTTDKIDENVFKDFIQHKCVRTEDMKCKADDFVRKVALIYGLYFPQSLESIKEQDLISRLTAYFKTAYKDLGIPTLQTIDIVGKSANEYIDKKTKELKANKSLEKGVPEI